MRSRAPSPVKSLTVACVLAAGLSALPTGCAGGPGAGSPVPGPPPVLLDQQGFDAALRRAAGDFRWPADHRPDLDRLSRNSAPRGTDAAPAGSERIILEIANSCAWYLSWAAAHDRADAAAAAAALQVLEEVLPTYGPQDPDGRRFAEEAAAGARAGDGSLARQFTEANCDGAITWAGSGTAAAADGPGGAP
ncbi:hypothetical protein [Streptomyces sp. NRRL F-2664]|uniref:hypothetical protein n=1 Tax=Streptomyces sp. NRRL F-2664 TaxID=1463842 RepID=UPI00131B24B2|nr:hypothetical protein [Streptomyces sp. NRRL F-2664]